MSSVRSRLRLVRKLPMDPKTVKLSGIQALSLSLKAVMLARQPGSFVTFTNLMMDRLHPPTIRVEINAHYYQVSQKGDIALGSMRLIGKTTGIQRERRRNLWLIPLLRA